MRRRKISKSKPTLILEREEEGEGILTEAKESVDKKHISKYQFCCGV